MTSTYSKFIIQKKPSRLILELSRNCNLECLMCGFGGHPLADNLFMKEDVLAFSKDRSFFDGNLSEIRLNGRGESTLHPKFRTILREVKGDFPRTRLTLFTNMMMPDLQILTCLREADVEIYVSVDSANPKAYERIRKGARFRTLEERLSQIENGFIVFTLQKDNFFELEEIGRFAEKFDFGLIINVLRTDDPTLKSQFEELLNTQWERLIQQLDALRSIIAKDRLLVPDQIWGRSIPERTTTTLSCGSLPLCPNILSEVMIGYDGTVFPCNMFNPEIYGNLKMESLNEIWNSNRHLAFLRSHKNNYYCKNCEFMIPKGELR